MAQNRTIRTGLSYLVVVATVAASASYAQKSQAGLGITSGYYSECVQEGCSSEEVREIYRFGSYEEECRSEGGCSMEERSELYNAGVHQDYDVTWRMEPHFCKIGKRVWWENSNEWAGPEVSGSTVRCN